MPKGKKPSKSETNKTMKPTEETVRPSKAARPHKTMKPTEETVTYSLSSELDKVAHILPHLYRKLTQAYLDGGGELNAYIIEEHLPGLIFETAKLCNWISNSSYRISNTLSANAVFDPVTKGWSDPETRSIGKWLVNKNFETEFFSRLEPGLSAARKIAESNATIQWQTPTPTERVVAFLDEQRWSKTRLIDKMADKLPMTYSDPVQSAKKQLKVIMDEPAAPNVVKDYHVVLRDVMRENAPSCADLEPLDLVWRYQS